MSVDDFEPAPTQTDLQFAFHGSIVTCVPLTPTASDWIVEHISDPLWYGGALCIEPRYLDTIVEAAQGDGLTCRAD